MKNKGPRRRSRAGGATEIPAATAQLPLRPPPHPEHRGNPVRVGQYEILAGGTRDLDSADLAKADLLIPLAGSAPFAFGRRYSILAASLQDFGGVPPNWREFLESEVIPALRAGTKVLVFCMGAHGRTGTFLASLIALLESADEAPDPIAAARERHCHRAVETLEQAEAVFALRGEPLPEQYRREFYRPPVALGFGGGSLWAHLIEYE